MLRLKYSTDNYIELYNDDLLVFRTLRTFPGELIWYNDAFDDWNYQMYLPYFYFHFNNNKLVSRFNVYSMTLDSISDVLSVLNTSGGSSNRFVYAGDDYNISISIKPEFYDVDLPSVIFQGCGGDTLFSSIYFNQTDFETNLYPELLDNEETKLQLQNWIDDTGSSWDQYTDKDFKAMELIEKYNKNVLLLRSTLKVNANVSGSISQSGQQSDLSGVENKLQNINNNLTNLNSKLEIEKTIDNDTEVKSITQIIDEKSSDSPIVVSSEDLSPWSAV